MIDQNSQFFAILTAVGEAKQANAAALGTSWTFAQMGVGDANGTDPIPSRTQTKLINERRRAPLNQVKVDPTNASVIIAEQIIPENVGGWWVRELALYDADGDMVAVANCAPTYKSLLAQGSGRTQVIRINLIVSSTSNIELKIDPSVVLATREYVDTSVVEALARLDFKHSVLVATTANIALSGIQTVDGVLLAADARVLVKDQAQAKDNGIYVVPANGAWKRAQDADASVEVTPGLFVSVEKGTANGDSVWQLVTDAPIALGTTALTFEVVAGRTGIAAGTYRSLTVDKLGRVIAGTNPTTLAGAGITDGRTLTNNTFDQVVIAKQGLSVQLGSGFNFYSADLAYSYYRTGHDASVWSFIVRLTDTSEVSAFDVGRATGKVSFNKRPTFAGNTPWDSGNFDPSVYIPVNGGAYNPKFSGISVFSEVTGYSNPGAYIGWGAAVTGTMQFICNKGAGVGGFSWRTVNSDNTVSGPEMTYSYAGRLTVAMELYVPAIPTNTVVPTQGVGYAGTYIANCAFVQAVVDAKTALATETNQGTMKVATDALMTDGGVDYVVATPKKLRKGMAFSFQPNGYFALPSWMGGLVIQWGTSAPVPNDGRLTVSYQLEFPTACFVALANYRSGAAVANHCQSYGVANISKTSFQIENQWVYADTATNFSGVWLAIGY